MSQSFVEDPTENLRKPMCAKSLVIDFSPEDDFGAREFGRLGYVGQDAKKFNLMFLAMTNKNLAE